MKENLYLNVRVSAKVSLGDGIEIVTERTDEHEIVPGEVAQHEAAHAVASDEIAEASIIPSGMVLGYVRPVKMTAAAAAAGAVQSGTDAGAGWDRYVTENLLGVSWWTAKSQAQSKLAGKGDIVDEVARELEKSGTINQSHVDKANQNLRKKRNGIHPVIVGIYKDGRKIDSFRTESYRGEVHVPTSGFSKS